MEVGPSYSNDDFVESCIFCLIANDQDKYTEIIKKDNELVCFRDIYPAAPHHYLVIPRQHIVSCFSLHNKHVDLVERMADMGKAVLREHAGITDMTDIRMGFHRPPYTSVDHIHLHVLAPATQISDFMVHKFIPGTYRFVKEDHLRRLLKEAAPKTSISGIDDWLFYEIADNQTETEIPLSPSYYTISPPTPGPTEPTSLQEILLTAPNMEPGEYEEVMAALEHGNSSRASEFVTVDQWPAGTKIEEVTEPVISTATQATGMEAVKEEDLQQEDEIEFEVE